MYKKIILSILFILISFPVLAEDPLVEKKVELPLTQFNMVTPVSCGSTKEMTRVFKRDQVVFTGLLENHNLIEVFINDEISSNIIFNLFDRASLGEVLIVPKSTNFVLLQCKFSF